MCGTTKENDGQSINQDHTAQPLFGSEKIPVHKVGKILSMERQRASTNCR